MRHEIQPRQDSLARLSQLLQIGTQAQSLQDQQDQADFRPEQQQAQMDYLRSQMEHQNLQNEQMPLVFDQETQRHVADMQKREFENRNAPILSQLEQQAMKQRQQIGEQQLLNFPLERQRLNQEIQNNPQEMEQRKLMVTSHLAQNLAGLGITDPQISMLLNKNLGLPTKPEDQYVEEFVRAKRPDLMSILDKLQGQK
jgi:hypothetical protein